MELAAPHNRGEGGQSLSFPLCPLKCHGDKGNKNTDNAGVFPPSGEM